MKSNPDDLQYFVVQLGDTEYGGWFRVLDADCIEVLAPGLLATIPLGGKSPEELSCMLLEQFVVARLRQGAPVPVAAPIPHLPPDHLCDVRGNASDLQS